MTSVEHKNGITGITPQSENVSFRRFKKDHFRILKNVQGVLEEWPRDFPGARGGETTDSPPLSRGIGRYHLVPNVL